MEQLTDMVNATKALQRQRNEQKADRYLELAKKKFKAKILKLKENEENATTHKEATEENESPLKGTQKQYEILIVNNQYVDNCNVEENK